LLDVCSSAVSLNLAAAAAAAAVMGLMTTSLARSLLWKTTARAMLGAGPSLSRSH
jgi:hypothetical protein